MKFLSIAEFRDAERSEGRGVNPSSNAKSRICGTKGEKKSVSLNAIIFFSLFFPLLTLTAESCININAAPEEELERIKHIGDARAKQIIKLRKENFFASIEELDHLSGIGPSRISDIKAQGLACVDEKSVAIPPDQPTTTSLITPSAPKQSLAGIKPPEQPLNPPTLLLTALIVAIFSGFAILSLKRKLKN